jgi:hypothetical protein
VNANLRATPVGVPSYERTSTSGTPLELPDDEGFPKLEKAAHKGA